MPTTNNKTDEWLPKDEAAALLGVQPRQLEKRAEQGYIRKETQPKRPHERAARVFYSRADIEAVLKGEPNVHATLVKQSNGTAEASGQELVKALVNGGDPGANAWRALALNLAADIADPADQKPWLTIEEAAEYSGLPLRFLRARAEAGTVHAVNVGTGKAKFWRFNRDGLNDIV